MAIERCGTLATVSDRYQLCAEGVYGPTGRSYWVVEGRFAAGGYPGKKGRRELERVPEVIQQLLGAGIDRFINLTQDYPGGTDEHLIHYDPDVDDRAEVERYPIQDLFIPTEEHMVEILDAIDTHLEAGHNVYAHCWGGVGRTGTVVGCWLIRHDYANSMNVLDVISDLRQGDAGTGRTRTSPETPDQWQFLIDWEQGR